VPGDDPFVSQPHQRDHVVDIVAGLESAGAEAGPAWKDRVVVDALLLEQLIPDLFWKAKCASWSPCR
jgi:hypothetical protein